MEKTPYYPGIKGFEFTPCGKLLDQQVTMSGEIGVAYERCIMYRKGAHTHDRPALVFPRGACVVEIHTPSPEETFRVDSSQALLLPADRNHDQHGESTIYDVFALFPEERLIAEAGEAVGLTAQEVRKLLTTTLIWKRSQLLDSILESYFFSRILHKGPPSPELALLERQLIHEVVRHGCAGCLQKPKALPDAEDVATRAIQYIEANLFNPIDVDAISRHAGTSNASLFRHFKKDFGLTPFEFVRNRRLDEAMGLLRTGKYPVGDVALLVGYEDFGAFSKAFKQKFRQPPSAFKKQNGFPQKKSLTS